MKVQLFSATIFMSILLTACGSDDDSVMADDGDLVTVLPSGETTLNTMEQIESVLANNDEIKAGQTVVFVLPQEQQTLALDSDLTVEGDLTIR